jgi:hypothetical protein
MRSHFVSLIAAAILISQTATAQDTDPCTKFTWNVAKELAVMKQSPQPLNVAVKPGTDVPQLKLETLYAVKLASQGSVTFIAKPAKPALDDGAQAGIVRFHTTQAGRYRVAITSGHWLDVVDGDKTVSSRDFQGARGCERPRKIVEFELVANHDYALQFSGSTDAEILVSITGAPAA